MRTTTLSANILSLPGSVFSGFFIYYILSYFLVPFRITAPLSIIMSLIIFGLTSYYGNEKVNPFGTETKLFRSKLHSNLFFAITYAILIISSFFYNQSPSAIFTPWDQIPGIQIVNLGIAISLSVFMPGYALVNIFDRKDELRNLPKFLLAYIFSALVTGLTGFIWGSLGFAVSDIKPIIIGVHAIILILFILYMVLKKDFQPHDFRLNSFFGTLKQNSAIILVFASLFALIILSTCYLYNGVIIGDQWTHHGKSLLFSSGTYKDLVTGGSYDPFEPFLPAFLAVFFTISGVPSVNAYAAIDFLNVIPVLAFYYFFTRWFPNHRRAALLASTLFMLSSGFGWKYVLSLANTHPITTIESAIQVFQLSGYRTFDIWAPNTFIDVGHPDITSPLIIFGLPAGFVLLGLIKENMNGKLRYFAVLFGAIMLGYLGHAEFGLFIIVASIIPLILKLDRKNSVFTAILATILFGIFVITFLSGSPYLLTKIFGVPLIYLLLLFASIMWALYASKIMFKVYNLKILPNRTKKILNRKIKIIIGIGIIAVFSFLYVFSFIIWNSNPTFDIRHDTGNFKVVPWYFYPLRFGVTGLLGFAFILSLIFRRYEKEVIVLGVIGIVAFLMGPYYNEFRFNKYIMVAFAGFASLLLFKILTLQSFLKPLRNGVIIGIVLTLSSLSILMYTGDTAIALETTHYTNFDNDLPRRHFPTDIPVLQFLHSNLNLKTDNVALAQNEAVRYTGFASQIEAFVGIPLDKPLQTPNILQGTNLEGFYTLLDYNQMRYVILTTADIKNGLSEISSFVLNNFPKQYADNEYVILSVPPLNPSSSNGDVTLLLPDIQYPVNSSVIFSNSIMDYKTKSLVLGAKFNQLETKVLPKSNTLWFDTPTNNVNYIESRFSVINETAYDNHSGIVWLDGDTEYYSFLRPSSLLIANSHDGELKKVTIDREDGVWYTLKIIYENNNIEIFVNNELKLQIARNSSDMPNISKVGIRSYKDATEFEMLKVGQTSTISFDSKYNYYYPVSALALSKIEYQTLSDQDSSIFSRKNIITTVDPLEENKYLEFVKNGGNIIVLNSDDNFNGQFSKIMSLKSVNKIKFNGISNSEGTSIKISGYANNIEINSADSYVTSFYAYNGQKVAPFIIEKKYGNGKIDFVNTRGYFDAISQSPEQYFTTIGNIPDLLHLTAKKHAGGDTSHTYLAQFVGGLSATGQILINGSSLVIPENDFYNLANQYGNYETSSSLAYENGSNYVKIHDLNLYGSFNVLINSTNLLYVPSSEFGYATLSFPEGFDMTIKLASGSHAEFRVDENNQTSEVTSKTIQFKGVQIQPKHSQNIILMRNPEITIINGNTFFDKLYSTNPIDPTLQWAAGYPMTIGSKLTIKIDHIDNDITRGATPMTYFRWITVDSSSGIYHQ